MERPLVCACIFVRSVVVAMAAASAIHVSNEIVLCAVTNSNKTAKHTHYVSTLCRVVCSRQM